MKQTIESFRRIVIKIGSALLVDADKGQLREDWLASIAEDVAALRAAGKDVILVSSGSIALGRKLLGLRPGKRLEENQAAAAAGQIELAAAYRESLGRHNLPVAQVLLTYGDTEERRRYLNARNTILQLLKLGVVPVINENDTVATDEMRYGDNDRLAARVATMCEADCLFLLSDIDGLYTADPNKNPHAEFVSTVNMITPQIERMAGSPISTGFGSGGMVTKIAAGKIATQGGCNMVIINGTKNHPVSGYLKDWHGTWFKPAENPLAAKKQWIMGTLETCGTLTIDDGAVKALKNGKSLLPAGVVRVAGTFDRGDTVTVVDISGEEIGRGLISYSSQEAGQLKGRRSNEIEQILGYVGREELIHRSDLVISGNGVK
ncbi:glutamate 5-kinase [Emcibacter nanhaiensis]|uniref:Glutamate 5-kinase n=1 Tax=Emcibacter nanhaiensis TaxID=1505037 RepID=A0A501PMI2_9PROT|nr:glutamate 5-kinase [Emcibacter nanhaiensis]TPD61643.1 glutamate 5-kinase [Emcibacter nanhaiensis]